MFEPGPIQVSAGIVLQYQYRDHFPDANVPGDSRAENVLPPCGQRPAGIGKAMSVTSSTKSESGLGETIRVVIYALLIALVIRTFLFQPFYIPSGSMEATLLVGDYLFIEKFVYGYSRYSWPFGGWPIGGMLGRGDRFFESMPGRGDVVVFKFPGDNSTDYIKRVIGLPG